MRMTTQAFLRITERYVDLGSRHFDDSEIARPIARRRKAVRLNASLCHCYSMVEASSANGEGHGGGRLNVCQRMHGGLDQGFKPFSGEYVQEAGWWQCENG